MTAQELRPGRRPGPGRLHSPEEEEALYDATFCAWCEEPLPTEGIDRLTCSERCRKARTRARQRARLQ